MHFVNNLFHESIQEFSIVNISPIDTFCCELRTFNMVIVFNLSFIDTTLAKAALS